MSELLGMKPIPTSETPLADQIFFLGGPFAPEKVNEKDLLKLSAYGIQLSADGLRPVLLLRDEKHEHTMPVMLNPLEAGVALTQSNKNIAPTTPHKVTEALLESLQITFEACVFMELQGGHQYVHLRMKNHPSRDYLRVRADEAMSLCLYFNVPMFATADYMARSRVLTAQAEGAFKGLLAHPEVFAKTHKFIM